MDVKNINDIRANYFKNINDIRETYCLGNSIVIESASKEILKILEGVQRIKAKAILQKAIELLDT